MKKLDILTMILLVVGGLNWGLVGAANFDLVATLFGEMSLLSRIVYLLVGLSAVYQAVQWRSIQRRSGAVLAAAALLGFAVAPAPLAAQDSATRLFVEGRAGAVIPTFDIADVATAGPAFGATIGYQLTPRWVVMGEFDYGMHEDEATESVDITTMHYMAKAGYSLTGPRERGWEALVNLGAGAVTFDVDGAAATNTYFAINAGAKIAYNFTRSLAAVLSPQGDIAFADEDELGTTNAWVWPVTAGVRVKF
jgi:hypothetical protein